MTSIVDEYTNKHSHKEAAEKINKVCGTKHRDTEISGMKTGRRGVSSCTHFVMLNECLAKILEDAGYTYKGGVIPAKDWIELINKITPPEPKK